MSAGGSGKEMGGRICVGEIARAYGLSGEFLVRSYTANPNHIASYGPLGTDRGGEFLRLSVVGSSRDALIARGEGIGDRSAAEALTGTRLYVRRDALPPLASDEFYHADLIGLTIELAAEGRAPPERIGRVAAVQDFGAGPLLEIEGSEVLVPFARAAVTEVDLAGGRIVVARVRGLFAPADTPEPVSADGQ